MVLSYADWYLVDTFIQRPGTKPGLTDGQLVT